MIRARPFVVSSLWQDFKGPIDHHLVQDGASSFLEICFINVHIIVFFQNPQFISCFSMTLNMGILTWNNLEATQKKHGFPHLPAHVVVWVSFSGAPASGISGRGYPPWRYEWSLKHWSQEFGTISWIIPVFFVMILGTRRRVTKITATDISSSVSHSQMRLLL